jgi:predicted Na+-dependent transporter
MLSQIEQVLLLLSFLGLMIGIGSSLETADVREALHHKQRILGGLALQYLLLPSLACGFIWGFGLSDLAAWALLLIASCPGGSTSNMFTYFSRGNVSLSLLLTFMTTLFSVVMTPLLLQTFGALMTIQANTITLPLGRLSGTLALALIPVLIGFGIRLWSKKWALRAEKGGSFIGYLSIIAMIILWYPKTQNILQTQDLRVFSAAGLLCFSGILLTLLLSLGCKAQPKTARTLSFETGIQNAPLAFAIISLNLPPAMALEIGWIPLVYGALSVANAAFFTLIYRLVPWRAPVFQKMLK